MTQQQRAWHEMDWRKMARLLAIPTILAVSLLIYTRLAPKPQVACVIERNGDLVKAWNEDCDGAAIRLRAE